MRNDARGAADSGNSLVALKNAPLPQDTLLVCNCHNVLLILLESYCQTLLIITQVCNIHPMSGIPRWRHGTHTKVTVALGGTTVTEYNTEKCHPLGTWAVVFLH